MNQRFVFGEISKDLYDKYYQKYKVELDELQKEITKK
jgi:hypothetical protein